MNKKTSLFLLAFSIILSPYCFSSSEAASIPKVLDNYNGIFFKNSEVFIDRDSNGTVSKGDILWGVLASNGIVAPTDSSGQTGPNLWPNNSPPAQISGYFATEVVETVPSGTTSTTLGVLNVRPVDMIVFGPTTDPNSILSTGEILRVYENDTIKDFNDSTQGSALSTATSGNLVWSFTLNPTRNNPNQGYWYSYAPVAIPASGPIGTSYAGMNTIIAPSTDRFSLIIDPNETSLNRQVEFWFNSEIFRLTINPGLTLGPNERMHFGSNDPAVYFPISPRPCITIIKKTNGSDANDPNGDNVPMISAGSQVTWDYEITNCGNIHVAKADVVVSDSQTGVTPAFASVVSGNNDDVLDPGEIWLYKATGTALDLLLPQPDATTVPNVCTHNGQLPPRTAYTNIGTVSIPGATASDPSSYCNPPAPCVTITKYTNGADADNPDAAGVPQIAKDQPVTWTFKVSNCGNISVAKADVVVTDNQPNVTPSFESELSGNGDSMFNPGEVWLFKATGTAINLLAPPAEVHVQAGVCTEGGTQPPRTAYVNIGTVTIPGASANNPSSYCNPKGPCVTIIKKTNGKDANDPNGADVPVLSTGAPVTWTYEITNCGNIAVASADVKVSDNQPGVTPSYTSGDANNNGMFDPGETWLYTASGLAIDLTNPETGIHVQPGVCTQGGTVQFPSTAYVNIGTVTIPGASATDPSSYCNPPPVPCVRIVKKTNGADANNPDGADVPLISANDTVTWTYEVSNCGSLAVPMAQVTVIDDQGVIPVFEKVLSGNTDSYFDPGEVWQYTATGTALDLSSPPPFIKVQQGVCTHDHTQPPRTAYINIGTVTIPGATASDPSSYCNPQEPFGGCRMTGGNVTVDNAIVCNPWAVRNSKAKAPKNANQLYTSYTVGGQIGAPKAGCSDTVGAAFGEWTHTQHSGAEGSFTFHAGTHSAPDDAFIKCITCADPGWCTQARCAPFKQIFFEGTGVFKNERGFNFKVPATCSTGVIPFSDKKHTLHYFKAHVGDFGEPGNTGKQKSFDPNVCKWRSGGVDLANLVTLPSVPDPKFGDKGGQACDTCPDWYEIEIHCTADPSSPVIYRGAGFITGGNYQIHPEVGQQCPF